MMMRRFWAQARQGLSIAAAVSAIALGPPAVASNRANNHVAEVVMDASTGDVLYERRPDVLRRPASLTKMMTLYVAFDALSDGRLKLDDLITVSNSAARQPPSRLGLRAGGSLLVRTALRAIAVHSANDAAFALAEKLAGSEGRFVALMNGDARLLGMLHTHFANATGLTNVGNVTTARDIAILSVALLQHHPHDYAIFATRSIRWQAHQLINHNHLLGKVAGIDGIKTGYTVDAGYNLAASAKRRGKRIVAVMLGAPSVAVRDVRVANLVELGFSSPRMAHIKSKKVRNAAASARRFHLKTPQG